MKAEINAVITDIVERFEAQDASGFREQARLIVPPEQIVAVAQALRDDHSFGILNGMSAVDYWPEQTPRFHVIYLFNSYEKYGRLEVRVPLEGNAPVVDTLTGVFPNADWHERELWDMFGLQFEGHPDLRRLLMPADWEGHPLRKDYPLGYEEVQFTFNFEEIELRKPRPKE